MAHLSAPAFVAAMAITLFAGLVKGAVGFAMPMIMMGAFSSFLPPEVALAGLILPTFVTNLSQAFRQGLQPALDTAQTYWRMLVATVVFIMISAAFVRVIPHTMFLLILGVPITTFAVAQLAGVPMAFKLQHRRRAEWVLGAVGGIYGGLSGIWGPPLLVYLLSIGADKRETVRVQGVVFLIGAFVLLLAHLQSGVITLETGAFSVALTVPAQLGQMAGTWVQDRLDQRRFRRWTQVLLVLTGLNLARLALLG